MKKYLAYYENEWPSNIAELTAVENKPFVGYLKGEGVLFTVISTKEEPEIDLTIPYVTFTAQEDNSSIGLTKLSTNQTLEYSNDTTTWNTFDKTTNISLNNGDKVYVRGTLSADNTYSNYTSFTMTGKIAASGNCNALWSKDDLNAPLKKYCGYNMFYSYMSGLTQAPALPATTLADYCYSGMFRSCTELTQAPELPATTLANSCYKGMFEGCTGLTQAPELPATTLAGHCYEYMFRYCTNLNYIKCLATDITASSCTYNWVTRVSSTGTFVKEVGVTWIIDETWSSETSGIPVGWDVVDAEL